MRWKIDAKTLPRNPDDFTFTDVAASVSYDKLATGIQVRMQPKRLRSARQVQLVWHYANEALRNAILSSVGQGKLVKIECGGLAPARDVWAYLDTPQDAMSKGIFDPKLGQGGRRTDLTITGQTDGPWTAHSHWPVPSSSFSADQAAALFGGPTNSGYDYLPTWNGQLWNNVLTNGASYTMSNLGTHPWSPIVKIHGPFSALTLNVAYEDVDGTGAGVNFAWLGTSVGTGDYILFDTEMCRCYWSVSGVINPTNAFSVTERSSGNPFPYWPDAPVGNFTVNVLNAAGTTGSSSVDYSNSGNETFRYM